ncbi:unnamed protein product [Caenorhabditis nigoni]
MSNTPKSFADGIPTTFKNIDDMHCWNAILFSSYMTSVVRATVPEYNERCLAEERAKNGDVASTSRQNTETPSGPIPFAVARNMKQKPCLFGPTIVQLDRKPSAPEVSLHEVESVRSGVKRAATVSENTNPAKRSK